MSQQKSSTEAAQIPPSANIKKGTPLGKQAKRNEDARSHWKKAAVEKTEKIKSERRMKNESRKQRDQLKLELELKVKELSNSEMLRNAAEQQHKEEHQKRIKVEKKLDEITEQLQSTEEMLKSMVASQGEITKKIHQVHLDLNEHFQNEHQLSDRIEDSDLQNSILTNELNIDLKIEELEKSTQSIREELEKEEKAHQERKQKISEEKKKVENKKVELLSLALALRENNHEFIKINQIHLEKNLITLQHRFQNKKSRHGNLISSSTRAKGHSYHIPIMKLSMELVCEGAIKIRTLEKSFKILSRYFDIGTPCRTTISSWSAITGLHIYNCPLEKGDDWVWMIDLSIPMGNKKLCLIIGVRLSAIKNGNFNITYKDTVLIHMSAMEVVNGDIILNQLKTTVMNRGVTPKYMLLDGGSDINKGVKNFCTENKETILINDISHKCANIVKASIGSEPDFIEFVKYITTVKNRMKNSSIAFLCPPKQRTKARFMGFRRVTKWCCLMVFDEAIGELEIDDLIKCCEYLGDLHKFSKKNIEWDMVFEFLEKLQKEIKRNGLTRGVNGFNSTSQKLKKMMNENQMLSEYATDIINEVINFVKSEEDKLPDGIVIIATTDILESIIGTWKSTISEDSLCGITRSVLTLPLLTKTLTEDLIKKAMEAVNWDDVNKWTIENIGPSMFSKRVALFKGKTSKTQEEAIAEILKGVDQVPSIELNDLPERQKCRRWSFSKSSKTTGIRRLQNLAM